MQGAGGGHLKTGLGERRVPYSDTMASVCPLEGCAAQPPLSLVAACQQGQTGQGLHRLSAVKLRSRWGPICPQTELGSLTLSPTAGPVPRPRPVPLYMARMVQRGAGCAWTGPAVLPG